MRWIRKPKPEPLAPINRLAIELDQLRPIIAEGICPVCDRMLEPHADAGCCPCCRGAYSVDDISVSVGACDRHVPIRCSHWAAILSSEARQRD